MIKDIIRKLLNFLHLDLTQNLKYDRLTQKIISKVVTKNSVCIDVGCHKGEILDLILKYSSTGNHYGFEPIPEMYNELVFRYGKVCNIYNFALSDEEGETTFQYVKNAPAYSGIKKRKYNIDNPEIEEIKVQLRKLDDVIPAEQKIDLIKIDVEGAELGVLKGAKNLIRKNKPVIIFECGKGATEFYGNTPEQIFDFIYIEVEMKISLLADFIGNERNLIKEEFVKIFNENSEYYFVAHA